MCWRRERRTCRTRHEVISLTGFHNILQVNRREILVWNACRVVISSVILNSHHPRSIAGRTANQDFSPSSTPTRTQKGLALQKKNNQLYLTAYFNHVVWT